MTSVAAGQHIRQAGEKPSSCCLLLEGFASASQLTDGDKRQITAFFIPGDVPDLRTLHFGQMPRDIYAITACRLALIEHSDLHSLCESYPRIMAGLWRSSLVTKAICQEWIVNLGRNSAISRLAHLFCELMARLEAVGLARNGRCDLPLTQTHLGEATGLSRIHVNRSLQELRRQGLITFAYGQLIIHDWNGLARTGQFDPSYLHPLQPAWQAA